jgi:hypothetical protein
MVSEAGYASVVVSDARFAGIAVVPALQCVAVALWRSSRRRAPSTWRRAGCPLLRPHTRDVRRAQDSDVSDSSDEEGLTPFEVVVKRDAFKRALKFEQQITRYEATDDRLEAITNQMKLWVKNTASEYDVRAESQTFVVTVFPRTPIKELRVRALTRAAALWACE